MRKIIFLLILIIPVLFLISSYSKPAAITEENLASCTLEIPGIENEYEFLYLTDTHIIIPDKEGDKQINDYSEQRLLIFKNQKETSSDILFSDWINYANTHRLDGLLLGGDIIDSPASSNLEYLDSSLSSLTVPFIYTLGNHDWTFPWEYMTGKGKEEYLPLLFPFMDNHPSIHAKEYKDFTFVAVDNSSNQINPDALDEYKKILDKKKPVILMLHVPLYNESLLFASKSIWKNPVILGGGIHGGIYPDAVSTEFIQLTTAKDSPVAAILAGHVHFGNQDIITGEKNIPQIVGDAGFKGKGTIIRINGKK